MAAAGARIEELLDQLASLPDRRAGQWAEDLVRSLTELYGECLRRVIEAAAPAGSPGGQPFRDSIAGDELVAALLIVHDLHPRSLKVRVEDALADLRSSLGEADVRLLELDAESLKARLRMVAPASPSHATVLETRLRQAVEAAAPELEVVEIDRLLPPTPVRLGRRPDRDPKRADDANRARRA